MQMTSSQSIAVTSAQPAPRRHWWRGWTNYLYIVPIFAFVVGLIYYGIAYTFYVSTLDWNGMSATRTPVGLKYYFEITQDPIFWLTLRNTAIFGLLAIFIQMGLGLLMAIMMYAPVHLRGVYKVIFFLPVVISPAVTAYVFRRIFNANDGELNLILGAVGLGALQQAWLADPKIALYALAAVNIWQWTGLSFLMYYAGLTLIEESFYEAARMDGANFFQLIWHITVPLVRPTSFALLILGVIGALKTFDIVFLVTGGGPGRSTEFLSTYIYKKAIQEFNAGYASALSVVMLLVALLLTVIQLRAYRDE
jgi:raffinose/stachyose/melibiose transport system permease protein